MKNNTKYIIVLVGALSLIALSALALSGSQDSNKLANTPSQDSTKLVNNDKPLYCEASASLVALDDEELSNNSDTIIIGTVKEILPSKWSTTDGKKPVNTDRFSPSCFIYTDIIISVDEYIKNSSSSKDVTVRVWGGTVGDDTFKVSEEPRLKIGEKVLLYLTKDTGPSTKDIGPEHYRVTGALQGKFTLTDDGKAIRSDKTVSQEELLSTIKE